jgi:hypothetical protein
MNHEQKIENLKNHMESHHVGSTWYSERGYKESLAALEFSKSPLLNINLIQENQNDVLS